MNQHYFQIVDALEKSGISREYILGWMGGYLGNPPREEQRVTEGYSAGYDDALNNNTDNASQFAEN